MAKFPLILTLRVTPDVDRREFEPNAEWFVKEGGSTALVSQYVRKEGGYLVGATETFRESMADIVSDTYRFCSLVVDQTQIVL